MIDKKLQLKPGQTIAVLYAPGPVPVEAAAADATAADAVLAFAGTSAELKQRLGELQSAAAAGRLTWLAYPKAGQLGTDLNRDIIRAFANDNGLDPVRQVAVDEVWSALRLKAM